MVGHLLRSERGAIVFEFFLVMPLFMSLLLGIFTGGSAYTKKISVVESVREEARFGASLVLDTSSDPIGSFETQVKNRVVEASGGDLVAGDVCVKFTTPLGTVQCGLSDPPGASSEPFIHLVKVSASKSARLEFFFYKNDVTLKGGLTARYERDTG